MSASLTLGENKGSIRRFSGAKTVICRRKGSLVAVLIEQLQMRSQRSDEFAASMGSDVVARGKYED